MKRFRLDYDDEEEWDDEEEFFDEEDGQCADVEVPGPSYAAVYTGLLKADGSPIVRHPLVLRMGFHTEDKKYHAPTLDEIEDDENRICGWVYA